MGSLSVIVITGNEERNIRECLESVRWADEIVVVDSESKDRTPEIAREFTEKVYNKPWEGYASAKSFALGQCSCDWVLWLDADERVTKELADEIQIAIGHEVTPFAGYEFPRKAYFLGRWIEHSGWYPGRVLRLFRRSEGSFSDSKVHERLEISGPTGRLHSDLLHYTDPDLGHYFEKFNRYTTLAAEQLNKNGVRSNVWMLLVRPWWVFIRMYILKRGFLDGLEGFILCVLSSCYVFTKYAKLWELTSKSRRSNR